VDPSYLRLLLASHLAYHLRSRLETDRGYTATAGISTNKLLAKLVGNVHKPNAQTTLVPPYLPSNGDGDATDNVTLFMDEHEIGKIPSIGFKIAQKIRAHILQRPAAFDTGLVYGGTKESVTVRDVRLHPNMGPETLERVLGGTGVPNGTGTRIWDLLNGCDNMEVSQARQVPTQISIEDSYIRLDTLAEVAKELSMLATSLLTRMHSDLLKNEEDESGEQDKTILPSKHKRWLAHPRTIRLSTRPRPPQNPDGSRNRSFARISKSAPMPSFVFNLNANIENIVERLLNEALMPLFRRLHPERSGWNLSLVNIAATNMADAASEKGGVGRDISKMFRQQDDVLKQWRINEEPESAIISKPEEVPMEEWQVLQQVGDDEDATSVLPRLPSLITSKSGSEDIPTASQQAPDLAEEWQSEDEEMSDADSYRCETCGAIMPLFALFAHERFHESRV
jgi:DNA polymerase iota